MMHYCEIHKQCLFTKCVFSVDKRFELYTQVGKKTRKTKDVNKQNATIQGACQQEIIF